MRSLLPVVLATTLLWASCGTQAAAFSTTRQKASDQFGDPSVTLTVQQPSEFLHSAHVTVQWELNSGNYDPQNDYISSWWRPFAATYLEYFNITGNTGSATFNLLNGREPIFFRYYRGDTMLAQSEDVVPEASYPMQVHVQFIPEHYDRALVIWVSNRTTGSETVYYGTSRDSLDHVCNTTTSATYTHEELAQKVGVDESIRTTTFSNLGARDLRCAYHECYNDNTSTELFVHPGMFHYAVLTGLQSNTLYHFQVGESDGWMSDVKSFHSRIVPGTDASIQLLYVADAGAGRTYKQYSGSASHNSVPTKFGDDEGARLVWDAIKRDPAHPNDNAVVMNGDISYARGWPWIWELFHNETEEIFSRAPVMAVYGNHEYDYGGNSFSMLRSGDSGGEAGIPTRVRFNLTPERPWYHMAQGSIHFFALSSEHSVTDQAEWLREELPLVNRTATPWVIVFLHRPIHTSSTWIDHELQAMMELGYSDLFSRYGVDMVLTGHLHYYERMCAINSDVCSLGFRPDWSMHQKKKLSSSSGCVSEHKTGWGKASVSTCKGACLQKSDCTGAYLDSTGKCWLSTCSSPLPFESDPSAFAFSLERKTGSPPVYIVDGTAGGSHTPTSSPSSPLTEYKDFNEWGYSRISATSEQLMWQHYHTDGSVVDSLLLSPVNAQGLAEDSK